MLKYLAKKIISKLDTLLPILEKISEISIAQNQRLTKKVYFMPQTPQQVLADLQNKTYAPVYFLQGEEPYYIDLIADYIENHVISEAEKGFNLLVLYGKEQTMGQVITHARRFPMIAQRQVVMVKEAQNMPDL